MEQVILNKRSGGTIPLFEKGDAPYGVSRGIQKRELLGEDIISMTIISATPINFEIGDWLQKFGEKYYLNSAPTVRKNGKRNIEYDLTFEGVQYELIKVQYLDHDVIGVSISGDFFLMGNLLTFANVLINNLNRVYGGDVWILGIVSETDYRNLSFSAENCLSVLQLLCREFEQEFLVEEIENGKRRISIYKPFINVAGEYAYGKGRGLYKLTRQTISERNIVTRLYAFGSDKNIPFNYRGHSKRLKLPANDLSYIDNSAAITKYGIIERTEIFDDIYPTNTGTITGLNASVPSLFYDSTMTFDLNETDINGKTIYLIPGVTAKIQIIKGKLAGFEFEVQQFGYDLNIAYFVIIPYTDNRGIHYPNDSGAFHFEVGDKYVILDIALPQEYIDVAENKLLTRAQAFLDNYSKPAVGYSLTFDEAYLKKQAETQEEFPPEDLNNYILFRTGDYVFVSDEQLGVNHNIRIKGFTRDLLRPYRYELFLSDVMEINIFHKVVTDVRTLRHIVVEKIAPPDKSGATGGDAHYYYPVNYLAQVTIQHNLNKRPAVDIIDETNNQCIADVEHLDDNQTKITFSEPFVGTIIFN